MTQLMTKPKDIELIIKDIIPIHFSFLKEEYAFPRECVLSSHLLYSFLKPEHKNIEIVYGTFGDKKSFHAWLKLKDKIMDVTLFQFLQAKKPFAFYKRKSGEELYQFALSLQSKFILEPEDEYYKEYKEIVSIQTHFPVNIGNDYETFFTQCKDLSIYETMNWRKSLSLNGDSFTEVLRSKNLRYLIRHKKWTIDIDK